LDDRRRVQRRVRIRYLKTILAIVGLLLNSGDTNSYFLRDNGTLSMVMANLATRTTLALLGGRQS
jgi:hypothetical protein